MVVIRWMLNVLVVGSLALVMTHASKATHRTGLLFGWKSGMIRFLASRP